MCPQSQTLVWIDNAKRRKAPWEVSCSGVVSLLEMLDFAAAEFLAMCTTLTQLSAYQGKMVLVPGSRDALITTLNTLNEQASRLNMRFVMNQVSTIYAFLEAGGGKTSQLSEMLEQLSKRVHEELVERQFFTLSTDKELFFQWYWLADTAIGRPALQSIREEFHRAGRCFAFGENTACVFHLMRVVEWIVKQVAKSLGAHKVTSLHDAAEVISDQMQKKYQTKSDDWKSAEPFYAQILNDIQAFSRGFRNDTAHNLERVYDDREARHLIGVVENFAIHVIQHLNLGQPPRIRVE